MPKPPVRSVVARIRVYPKELATWKRRARADAMTLSTWIRERLNDESPSQSRTQSAPGHDGRTSS